MTSDCPCCHAYADVARLTAERDADRACAAGFAAELAQAHDLLASAVPGGPLADRIRALLSLWSASVVEKAKLQRERDALKAEIEQARDVLDALENETLVEAARDLAHEYETTNAAFHSIHSRYWKGAVPALRQIANHDDAEMANARTLHYDMRGWARAALNVPQNPSARPQDELEGRTSAIPHSGSCARCGSLLDNVSPGYSVVAGGASVCAPCLRPGEELLRAKSL